MSSSYIDTSRVIRNNKKETRAGTTTSKLTHEEANVCHGEGKLFFSFRVPNPIRANVNRETIIVATKPLP